MKTTGTLILLLCLSSLPRNAEAHDNSYDCIINHVYELTDYGYLEYSNRYNEFKGKTFTVSRKSGDIEGKALSTTAAEQTKVINFGSNNYSFRTIAYFSNMVQFIEIQEFTKNKKKPFIAIPIDNAGVITGTCD